ncbi:hypothetical protein [Aquabacterium humicola]|uniref:hypothetical protein n=1 Tax=Aquabacterium humicola TaxID=3237377 RepID=UPI0025428F5C|nr:hypothetical protein [Rubrivivax pictus]
MSPVQTIRRIGFRKWYERELLRSHANLVLLLLSAIGLLTAAEIYDRRIALSDQLQVLACAAASAAIGLHALRRYLYLLNHAEFVADQAVCGRCERYASFDSVDEGATPAELNVCCRHCRHEWVIRL